MTFCHKNKKTSFLLQKRTITAFLSRKFMIMCLLIAYEDLLGSSIAPQVMPSCFEVRFNWTVVADQILIVWICHKSASNAFHDFSLVSQVWRNSHETWSLRGRYSVGQWWMKGWVVLPIWRPIQISPVPIPELTGGMEFGRIPPLG